MFPKPVRSGMLEISTEIADVKFAYTPKDAEVFFESDNLYGDSVNDTFPSVKLHIKDAGNYLAADLDTAAAFHLMLTAELGLPPQLNI